MKKFALKSNDIERLIEIFNNYVKRIKDTDSPVLNQLSDEDV